MIRRVLIATLALLMIHLIGACAGATGDGGAAPDLRGSWSFVGAQTSPQAAELHGVLEIGAQEGDRFTGTIDLLELTNGGSVRQLVGQVSGRVLEGTIVDFDATIDAEPRRHVAALSASGVAMEGEWVNGITVGSATGAFRCDRGGEAQ
jgi:hypothetical protein